MQLSSRRIPACADKLNSSNIKCVSCQYLQCALCNLDVNRSASGLPVRQKRCLHIASGVRLAIIVSAWDQHRFLAEQHLFQQEVLLCLCNIREKWTSIGPSILSAERFSWWLEVLLDNLIPSVPTTHIIQICQSGRFWTKVNRTWPLKGGC